MSAPAWDAVVVTLSGGERLWRAVESIRRQVPAPASIVVVANGTVDAALAPVAELAGIRILRLPRNLGFAGGANRGIAGTTAPFVALVNDDVVLAPGWAAALLAEAASPEIASLQGEVRRADGVAVDSLGLELTPELYALQLESGAPAGRRTEPFDAPGVSAAAALYRRSALDRVSVSGEVFVPTFFAWYEDVDLALRLFRAGGRARIVPAAIATHEGTATGGSMPFLRFRCLARNRRFTIARNLSRTARRRLALRNLVADVRTLRIALRSGVVALLGALLGVLEALVAPAPPEACPLPKVELDRFPSLR